MPPKKSPSVRKKKDPTPSMAASDPPLRRSASVERAATRLSPAKTKASTPKSKSKPKTPPQNKCAGDDSPLECEPNPQLKPILKPNLSSEQSCLPRFLILVVVVVLLLGGFVVLRSPVGGYGPVEMVQRGAVSACPCAAEAYHSFSKQGDVIHSKLAGVFLSSYASFTGVHVKSGSVSSVFKELGFVRPCSVVIPLTKRINNVEELTEVLKLPFAQSRCVVWVADANLFRPVLNPLKELFEDNTLRGIPIAPAGKKGFLILVSSKSREELKEEFPHRVVHMLNTVDL